MHCDCTLGMDLHVCGALHRVCGSACVINCVDRRVVVFGSSVARVDMFVNAVTLHLCE